MKRINSEIPVARATLKFLQLVDDFGNFLLHAILQEVNNKEELRTNEDVLRFVKCRSSEDPSEFDDTREVESIDVVSTMSFILNYTLNFTTTLLGLPYQIWRRDLKLGFMLDCLRVAKGREGLKGIPLVDIFVCFDCMKVILKKTCEFKGIDSYLELPRKSIKQFVENLDTFTLDLVKKKYKVRTPAEAKLSDEKLVELEDAILDLKQRNEYLSNEKKLIKGKRDVLEVRVRKLEVPSKKKKRPKKRKIRSITLPDENGPDKKKQKFFHIEDNSEHSKSLHLCFTKGCYTHLRDVGKFFCENCEKKMMTRLKLPAYF